MQQPEGGNVRYYQILGLPRTDASPADIKRGYKKMSLKYHPDRNPEDPDATTKFQEVSHAYSVLSQPRLRQVYDSYGDQGLKMYESYMSFAEAEDGSKLPVGPVMLLMLICLSITFIVGLVTAFGIMLLLKLNDSIETSFVILFTPLWVLDAIVLLCIYVAFMAARSRAAAIGIVLVQLLAFTAFEVLLALRQDNTVGLSYAIVFTPLYALEGVLAARAAMAARPSTYDGDRAAGNTLLSYPLYVMRLASWVLARASLYVLLALRLDGTITCLYTIVLLPLWLLVCMEFFLSCASARADSQSERAPVLKQLALGRSVVALFCALILVLLCVKLDAGSVSWMSIFWPLFLASSIYFCCCCCLCCALSLAPRAEVRDVPPPDAGGYVKSDRPLADSDMPTDNRAFDRPDLRQQGESTPLMAAQQGEGYKTGGTVSPPDEGA
mmetsp:Transcript_5881/g.17405  ORF Transcript_5881/g.17405 Transcript_5881/m.17405 type:complete len:439 (+) Transcript_5881:561-1877(+)